MRSILAVLVIIAVARGSDWKEKARHMDENYARVKSTCVEVHDISDSEIKAIEAMDVPQTRREKCISECLLTESGIMADGQFSRIGSDTIAEYLYDDDPETLNIARAVSKRCEKIVERMKIHDSCEVAAETIKCLRRTSKQLGVKQFFKDY